MTKNIPSEHSLIQAGDVQRRTLVSGAAWTIPVAAAALATPASAASQQKSTDLQITSLQWNAQGGTGQVPADATFNADNGLFVDADVKNNGPDSITGIKISLSLNFNAHQMDPANTHYPTASTGWNYSTSYNQGTTNRVVEFVNSGQTLAPGETVRVRINYWTTPNSGVTVDNIKPYVSFQPSDSNYVDSNQDNNGTSTVNSYNVHT
ncbi:hypothetical protein [Rathayibacter toxicus]|uniref:DUF11 domain-containing protein n=1 Tax=Rathayibacter toxicus TaxID=145458 RepID=A0A0C5BFZ4_9MICO|nr:hypothetical protein [Rathayibacter toxicus]AJM77110.1 hypothetical protein TI83_02315 [Rathayibacter toxicus]ALS57057.1 hypothetical protein APU90_04160 [Rathayibacter toxicus]KKM46117.1 hypothetical protein VT73_03325 [Rathayibacter toxicus]PPG23070.1 hypothetical protein C5D15_02110 [Rathayibacter toxicus]PPG47652.1 hypothetical protein C5D16_02105 [Rathayibacter toxicus]